MLFLAWVWARVGVVGDGLVSIETHNNSGDCFRSARVLVRLCLLDLEAVLLPVLTRFGAAGLGGVVSVFWVGRFGALNWCARACWLWCVVCSLAVGAPGWWACEAGVTCAGCGEPDLVNKVEPQLR